MNEMRKLMESLDRIEESGGPFKVYLVRGSHKFEYGEELLGAWTDPARAEQFRQTQEGFDTVWIEEIEVDSQVGRE